MGNPRLSSVYTNVSTSPSGVESFDSFANPQTLGSGLKMRTRLVFSAVELPISGESAAGESAAGESGLPAEELGVFGVPTRDGVCTSCHVSIL
jgi:hypothetical protein